MNAIAKLNSSSEIAVNDDDAIRVLQSSLYPGAKDESVRMVLAWCRATGRDPMKKPVHIVPMNVKVSQGKWEWRDTIMPGIGTYRTDAARTGQYAGKSEPEFGPDETRTFDNGQQQVRVTFPKWCKVTVYRQVGGQISAFPAKEYWVENYASAGKDSDAPNAMWKKRPYGQLAKCAEAQALRMAFPEETGNTNTMEEMEGKSFDAVALDVVTPQFPASRPALLERPRDVVDNDAIPSFDAPPVDKLAEATDRLITRIEEAAKLDAAAVFAISDKAEIQAWRRDKLAPNRPELEQRIVDALRAAAGKFTAAHAPTNDEPAPDDMDDAGKAA